MPDLNRSDEKLHSDRKEIAKRRHRSEVVLNYVLRLMLLGLIGWFFYCAYSFCAAYVQHTQLQRNGREAEGVIESYGYISRNKAPNTYRLHYTFLVGDQTYRGKSDVWPSTAWQDHMTVIYDTQDPNNNKLKEGMDSFEIQIETFLTPVIVCVVVFGSMALFYHFRRIRRARHR